MFAARADQVQAHREKKKEKDQERQQGIDADAGDVLEIVDEFHVKNLLV
jgi:hypothetical protein